MSKGELSSVLKEERLAAKVFFRELDADASGDVSLLEWMRWLAGNATAPTVLEWIEDRLGPGCPRAGAAAGEPSPRRRHGTFLSSQRPGSAAAPVSALPDPTRARA